MTITAELCPPVDQSGHDTIADRLRTAVGGGVFEDRTDIGTRQAGPAAFSHDDRLVAGLTYRCDYRAEEEWGLGDLRRSLCGNDERRHQMTPDAAARVSLCRDANAFALSTRTPLTPEFSWGDELGRSGTHYVSHWDHNIDYCRYGIDAMRARWSLEATKVDELRTIAADSGVERPFPRRKSDLVAAILAATHPAATNVVWPAWFHDGTTLVVRADDGPTAVIVEALRDALGAGTFAVGSASGPFHSGVLFYDARDETAALRAEREAGYDWHDARMAELAPVRAELEAKGHRFYFVGRPTERAPRDKPRGIYYWLNGGVPGPKAAQAYGWYSLDELAAEVFVDDARARYAEKVAARAAR